MKLFEALYTFKAKVYALEASEDEWTWVLGGQVFSVYQIEFLPEPLSGVSNWNDFYRELK